MIEILGTGLIYRNPKPHVHGIHATFPSVGIFPDGEMLATLVLGEAFEAANCHAHLARSRDGGETWQMEGPLYPGTRRRLTSDACRLTVLPDGEAVAFMVRADRTDHPEEGLANPKTMGFVPTELLMLRSSDRGRTWTKPRKFRPPLEGPSFELCCPMTPLSDGRWILPTSTWPGWNGDCPNGIRLVAFVSRNKGRTWPATMDVMSDPQSRYFYWESKIVEFPDKTLMDVAWVYDRTAAKDLPNQYALSRDGGKTWTAPQSTGLSGQTLTPFLLEDSRILSVYRRMDESGLWANVSHLEGDRWVNDETVSIWGSRVSGLTSTTNDMAHNFNVLRFGAPCISRLADGTLFMAFWCYEDCVSNIRWYKLKVGNG
ncbi:MAG: exo-alpha-sialidase [Lentisphaerae bacterium]|nr:exo-alpha-sialidase [Lentisphaerota bacterium]